MSRKTKIDIETRDKKAGNLQTDKERNDGKKAKDQSETDMTDRTGDGEKDKAGKSDSLGEKSKAKKPGNAGENSRTGNQRQSEKQNEKENAEDKQGQTEQDDKENAAESEQENDDLQAKYIRLAADFQNFRRRTENEKQEIYAFANENLVKDLLNVLDNFERAIDQAKDSNDPKYADGVALIYKQFKEVLEKFGMQEIPALSEDFDPNKHHAVMMDTSGAGESGKVTEVLQKGYTLNNRVIRPSMVKVAE